MQLRTLLIIIAVLMVGTGGKFAHDDYQEHKALLKQKTAGESCSFCDLVKQDKKQTRDDNLKKQALEQEKAE